MRAYLLLFSLLLLLLGCKAQDADTDDPTPPAKDLIRGADLSFLPEIEAAGTAFFDRSKVQKEVLTIFQENGCNMVRLRLWHTPATPHSGSAEVAAMAQRVRDKGMKVWLDIHYSDTWADPGQQVKPAAWQSLDFPALQTAVYDYTKQMLALIKPDMVQIGNEINNGFLWPMGKLDQQPAQFIQLLKQGIQAARDYDPTMKVMVHYAGINGSEWYYNNLKNNAVNYDYIGLSYYPKWHGKNLDTLRAVTARLAEAHGKQIVLAEIAYPFTSGWNDNTNNIFGDADLIQPAYPATQEGQKAFLLRLREIVEKNKTGIGFCYWAPEWVAFKGKNATDGSPWENQALFDFQNGVLPGIELYKK